MQCHRGLTPLSSTSAVISTSPCVTTPSLDVVSAACRIASLQCSCTCGLPENTAHTLCRLPAQVRVRVDRLLGRLPALQHTRGVDGDAGGEEARTPALYVVAALCALGEVLALPARSPYAQAAQDGCSWGAWLTFPIKVPPLLMLMHPPLLLRMPKEQSDGARTFDCVLLLTVGHCLAGTF